MGDIRGGGFGGRLPGAVSGSDFRGWFPGGRLLEKGLLMSNQVLDALTFFRGRSGAGLRGLGISLSRKWGIETGNGGATGGDLVRWKAVILGHGDRTLEQNDE